MNGMDPKEHYSIQNGMGGHEVLFNVFKVFTPSILLADHLYIKGSASDACAMRCTEVGSAFLVVISVTHATS